MREHRQPPPRGRRTPPILICGASGTLGRAFAAACIPRAIPFVLTSRAELALDSASSVHAALSLHRPWAVINAAGWVRVDEAEDEEEACRRANALGHATLAAACAARGAPCIGFSSDLVFDGRARRAYVESDPTAPLSAYGRSKAEAERLALALGEGQLLIRTAAFFSPNDVHNFAVAAVGALARGERFLAAEDHVVSPTYVPHLVDAALDLLIDGASGVWHLSSGEAVTWAGFARRLAEACRLDPGGVEARPGEAFGWRAPRPAFSALASERGVLMPPLAAAIDRFAAAHGRGAA